MKQLLIQALNLMRQNRFHTVVSIVGTAVTIAFVMVVAMIYDFRTSDIAPETDRSRMMYTDVGHTARRDGTNARNGMGRIAFDALFDSLPGVKEVTWYAAISKSICSLPASSVRYNYFVRSVAPNWFSFFRYDFIAGRPFAPEEHDAKRRTLVLTEHIARQLFGSADAAIGKELWANFLSFTVVGVVRNVSSILQTVYADAFEPFSLENEDRIQDWTSGLGGIRRGVLKLQVGAHPTDIRAEVQRREERLNSTGMEYEFEMQRLYTHTDYTFFRDSSIDARLIYALLVFILLVVPAISISGLMNAQMQSRLSEIAVRKAYGASNLSIISRLFSESLLNTLLGGVAGYILSFFLVWLGRTWLFGSGGTELTGITLDSGLLLRPSLFFIVLAVCIVFNVLSTLLPAWMAVHRNISSTLKGGE